MFTYVFMNKTNKILISIKTQHTAGVSLFLLMCNRFSFTCKAFLWNYKFLVRLDFL